MAYLLGLIVGTVAGVVLWGELASALLAKLGFGPRSAIFAGAASTLTLAIVGAIVTDQTQIVGMYALGVPVWIVFKIRGVAARERSDAERAQLEERHRGREKAATQPAKRKSKHKRPRTADVIHEPAPIEAAIADAATTAPSKRCEACNAMNEADAKFCDSCGTGLERTTCEACSAQNRARAAHCKACGVALRVS